MARSRASSFGWIFRHYNASNVKFDFHPPLGVTISHDQSRQVRRSISGLTLLPRERVAPGRFQREGIDLSQDQVELILIARNDRSEFGVEHRMGIFNFTEVTIACDAVAEGDAGLGVTADLYHVGLGDNTVRLQRSTEVPLAVPGGTNPTSLMIRILGEAGMRSAIASSDGNLTPTSWPPFTKHADILAQLGEVAGHRRFWADNDGTIRSISANVVDTEVIELEDLGPTDGSISITENYLSSPNRVVVQDDQALYPTIGVWDAPASSPSAASRRGYVLTHGVSQQAINGPVHAQRIAQSIGERFSAATLSANVMPTWILDGPRVLRYRGRLWLLDSWSISTEVGATMSIQATELVGLTQ